MSRYNTESIFLRSLSNNSPQSTSHNNNSSEHCTPNVWSKNYNYWFLYSCIECLTFRTTLSTWMMDGTQQRCERLFSRAGPCRTFEHMTAWERCNIQLLSANGTARQQIMAIQGQIYSPILLVLRTLVCFNQITSGCRTNRVHTQAVRQPRQEIRVSIWLGELSGWH